MPAPSKLRKQKYAAGRNAALYKALSHPLRYRIMMVLGEVEASPKELQELLEEPFHRVCEHVRILRDAGVIELVDEDTRRGGTQHIYKASTRPTLDAEAWGELPKLVQEAGSVSTLSVAFNEARAAVEAGAFDSHPRRVLIQKPMIVDEQGWVEVDESLLRQLAELDRIATESATRLAERGEPGQPIRTALIAHPAAPPADSADGEEGS